MTLQLTFGSRPTSWKMLLCFIQMYRSSGPEHRALFVLALSQQQKEVTVPKKITQRKIAQSSLVFCLVFFFSTKYHLFKGVHAATCPPRKRNVKIAVQIYSLQTHLSHCRAAWPDGKRSSCVRLILPAQQEVLTGEAASTPSRFAGAPKQELAKHVANALLPSPDEHSCTPHFVPRRRLYETQRGRLWCWNTEWRSSSWTNQMFFFTLIYCFYIPADFCIL